MTFVNVIIETSSEWRAAKWEYDKEAEVKFWRQRSEQLQRNLENIWEHAKKTGRIELYMNREKMVLLVEPSSKTQG